jgi:GT2 family glycosyltransferase
MARKLDIGIASYGNHQGLDRLITSLYKTCKTDWTARVVVNPHPDESENMQVKSVLDSYDGRVISYPMQENLGYVGAVNVILRTLTTTEYIAYCDHDVVHHTEGWDEMFATALDRYHELGMIFANGGAYPIQRDNYTEILWGVGCCWMLPRRVSSEVGLFDSVIGHHEEVDYQTRVRLAGYKIAALPGVVVHHAAKASNDPASHERISQGVIKWVTKWTNYFCGKRIDYFSPNVMRHEDWPPSALYLEEYFKLHLPDLNKEPEVVNVNGQEYDLIKVPRLKGFYRNRII